MIHLMCRIDVNSLQFLNVNERSLILVLLALFISPFSPKNIWNTTANSIIIINIYKKRYKVNRI